MPLQKQTLDLQIVGGMNEKVDIYTSTIPDLLSNCRYTKTGSLAKRPGSTCLTPITNRNKRSNLTTEDAGTATMLCQVGSELLRAGGGDLDRVYKQGSTSGLVWRDRVSALAATRKGVASNVWAGPSVATNGTITAVFYISVSPAGLQPRLEVFDTTTGERVIDPVELGSVTSNTLVTPRVLIIGSYVYCLWGDSTGAQVTVQAVNPTTGAAGTSAPLTATGSAFDCATDGTHLYVAFTRNATGANRLRFAQYVLTPPSTYVLGSFLDFGGADATLSIPAVCRLASGAFIVGYGCNLGGGGTSGYRVTSVNSALSATTWGPTTALAPGVAYSTGWLQGGICESPTSAGAVIVAATSLDYQRLMWSCVSSGGTAATARSVFYEAQQWTKPFTMGTKAYLGVWLYHLNVSGFFVWRLNEWTGTPSGEAYHVEANIAPQAAYPLGGNATFLVTNGAADVAQVSSTQALLPALTGGLASTTATSGATGELVTLSAQPTIGLEAAGGGVFTGGTPACYDGSRCSEFGFFYPPNSNLLSATASAGAGLSAGTYSYIAVYSYKDELGRIHRSQVSATVSATAGGGSSQITVVVPNLQISNRNKWVTSERCVNIEIYRTAAGGASFFLRWVGRNDPTALTTTVVDSGSSGTGGFVTGTGPLIYTTGGIKEMVSPPSGTCAWVANQRLWLGGTDDDTVWYTDEFVAEEPPTFRDGFYLPAWEGGRVVAGAALDDKVIVFKQSSIWYTFGDGPDSTGVGAFASFRSLASDVGCVDPRSVVQVPDGILFQSKDGLCLLTRALQVVRIGKPVEDSAGATQATPYAIVGAVAVPGLTEIRFPVDVTGEMRAVVYDYFHGNPQTPIWYRYTWTSPIGGTPKVVAACAYQGVYTWIDSDGYVWQDSTSTWLDTATGYTSTWVTMTAKLSCWNPQKVQGLMRVYQVGVLGSRKTDCDMAVSLWFDYKTGTASQTATFLASALSSYTLDQVAVRPSTQKLQAIQVQFSDATPTGGTIGTGEGVRLAAVSLEVGIRSGLPRLPAGAKG